MEREDSLRDVDPKHIADLSAITSKDNLYKLFMVLIDNIETLSKENDATSFAKGVHAQLGAALNLGAERTAKILRAADTQAIDSDQARRALEDALPGLRTALARCGIAPRNG